MHKKNKMFLGTMEHISQWKFGNRSILESIISFYHNIGFLILYQFVIRFLKNIQMPSFNKNSQPIP